MNFDIKAPLERINNIISLVQPVVLITNKQYLETVKTILPDSVKICLIGDDLSFDEQQEKDCQKRFRA